MFGPTVFYRGDKPTFAVIRQHLDVIKKESIESVKTALKGLLNQDSSLTIPLVFLEGSFGAGKTTFTYRIANELRHDEEIQAVCFEVLNPRKLKAVDLAALFEKTKAQTIVLVANDIEPNNLFQAVNDLRYQLSVEQFKGFKIVILASIRENILQKYEVSHPLKNVLRISVDAPFTEEEVRELLEKLRDAGLVQYRTERELRNRIKHVLRECDGDLLLSYIDLLTDSHHDVIVREAFSELTETAQESVLKISLLYRFGILMPMTLLRSLIRKSWEEFREKVVDYDSKNIIVKEESKQFGTEPDIYLRIKHRLIANLFVKMAFRNEDKLFQEYQKLLRHLNEGPSSASMVVDLLKAIRMNSDLAQPKIDKLFDEVSNKFQEDPHFAVHYAMNLQRRGTKESLLKGVDILSYAGSFSDNRNDRIIHRRAVINYRLARHCFEEEQEREVTGETRHYIEQAQTNFDLKVILDPASDFSYANYLEFLLWRMDKFELDAAEADHLRVQVEELIEQAEWMVQDGLQHVLTQKDRYFALSSPRYGANEKTYVANLNEQLDAPDLRPFALILLYYHYKRTDNFEKIEEIVSKLETEKHLDAAVRLLFKHYGQSLYDVNVRQRLLSLEGDHSETVKRDKVRYHYYRYVTYSYNKQFAYAWEELNELRKVAFRTNPDLEQVWCDDNGDPRVFEAKYDQARKHSVFVPEIQRSFSLRGKKAADEAFNVILRFLVWETVAVIIPKIP